MGFKLWFYISLLTSVASAQVIGGQVRGARGTGTPDFATGTFVSGTINRAPTNGQSLTFHFVGSLNTINFSTPSLVAVSFCPLPTLCYTFAGGTISVPTAGSQFQNIVVTGGIISVVGHDIAMSLGLLPQGWIQGGSGAFDFAFSGTNITQGSGGVQIEGTPP